MLFASLDSVVVATSFGFILRLRGCSSAGVGVGVEVVVDGADSAGSSLSLVSFFSALSLLVDDFGLEDDSVVAGFVSVLVSGLGEV